MRIETAWQVPRCMASPQNYASSIKFGAPTKARVAKFAMQVLEDAFKADQEAHEANKPILKANALAIEKLEAVMAEIGMPRTFRRPMKSRARFQRYETVDAGWIADMRREFPGGDGFELVLAKYSELKARYEQFAAEAEKEEKEAAAKAELEKARAIERQNADIRKALIIIRYELDAETHWTWFAILEFLRKRDQRLDLAVAMRMTRGDWSEGYWRVSDAMTRFKIRDDVDKDIIASVGSCFGDDFIDGRVFRDCAWNYDRLFAEAEDRQLSEDVQFAMERSSAEGWE